jgi:hypothetical protein
LYALAGKERALQEITPAAKAPGSGGFREATRELKSLTGSLERKVLYWFAARLPPWVNSDHLTVLGFLSMVAAGACYALTSYDPRWLHAVNVLLVVNWFGDSLDGTLARHRNRSRPRYGFYVDHIVDMYGFLALLGGLAVSPYMSRWPSASSSSTTCSRSTSTCPPTRRACSRSPTARSGERSCA